MKHLVRTALTARARRFLHQRTEKVTAHDDPRAEAKRLWRYKRNRAFDEIRQRLGTMATGLERCMYCEDSQGTDIDHFWPKATYPERAFLWENYLLACSHCNSNCKRDQFPLDAGGQPQLIDPTVDEPLDHLAFSPATGDYQPLTAKGQPTIDVCGLRRAVLVRGRQRAWTTLQALLLLYARRKAANDPRAARIPNDVRDHPFAGVFAAFLRIAASPAAAELVEPGCLQVLADHPEIRTWA